MADPTIFTDEFNLDGNISLREAIRDTPNGGTIQLAAGTYQLTLSGFGEDAGATGDLDIDGKTLTIEGIDSNSTLIEWPTSIATGSRDRLFHILNSGQLTLRNVTLRNGFDAEAFSGGGAVLIEDLTSTFTLESSTISGNETPDLGGAIYNNGTLSVLESQVSNNRASDGGAIYTGFSTTNTITGSTLAGNQTTTGDGGAIANSGSLTVNSSTIQNNTAIASGGGIYSTGYLSVVGSRLLNNDGLEGGGVHNKNTVTTSQIVSSTLSDNRSTGGDGGAILNDGNLNLETSTIANNTSALSGGGLFNSLSASSLVLQNSTISGNSTSSTGGGAAFLNDATIKHSTIAFNGALGAGGGLYIPSTVTLTLENSIISNSTSGSDVSNVDPIVLNGRNIVADASFTGTGVINQDPLLNALGNNGGNLQTHALQSGSPAIDAALNSTLTTDQRGVPRDTSPDLGAYEFSTIDIISFFETAGSTQAIEGVTDADVYAVRLGLQPSQPVTISFSVSENALSLSASSLTFTPSNWNTPQFVMVSIGDNRTSDGTRTTDITPTSASDDTLFENFPLSNIGVTVADNDSNPGETRDLADTPNSAIILDIGDDIVTGSSERDFIISRKGDDLLLGLGGDDYLLGNGGNDGISGGDGNDYLSGRAGQDYLSGGDGRDVIFGGEDEDLLYGGNGDDLLGGGDDDDQLYGGLGNDTLIGGLGFDIYSLDTQSIDTIRDFSAGDALQFLDGSGFDDIAIEAGSSDLTGSSVVRILSRNQVVAVLEDVSPGFVTASNVFPG